MPGLRLLSLYFSFSREGRSLLRRLWRMLNEAGGQPHYRQLLGSIKENISRDRKKWFCCLRASDRGFNRFIPAWYIRIRKNTAQQIYYSFFKMGAILLYEHLSLFMAYNIKVNEEARQRCVLVAFLKRVYDDLIDKQGINKDLLFTEEPVKELVPNPDYRLFMELRGLIRRVAPRDRFPQYYRLLPQVSAAQAAQAPYKIKNGFLLDMYIMENDLPEQINRAMDITAEFFAYLDDFYDYDEDLSQGKSTPVNRSPEPLATLEKKFAETCVYLRANSPNPEAYLGGLGNLMRNVLFLRENRLNKLSLFI